MRTGRRWRERATSRRTARRPRTGAGSRSYACTFEGRPRPEQERVEHRGAVMIRVGVLDHPETWIGIKRFTVRLFLTCLLHAFTDPT